jgi:hypothetical protein
VKALIASNSIVRPADLKKCLKVSDDVSALMDDLFYLEKGRTAWRQMAALRARKVNALLEAAITDGGKAWGIPAAALEKIRLVLKEKYKERLEIDFSELADDVENEYAKMMLEELVK